MKTIVEVGACLVTIAILVSCSGPNSREVHAAYVITSGGDARAGHDAIRKYGCNACHTISGVPGADGLVGPPLAAFARRTFIAGSLPNTPENLVEWVRHPESIEPHTAMPALALSEQQARDVAAYLYTLRGEP